MNNFEIFKTISIGKVTKDQLLRQLIEAGIQINEYAKILFEHQRFSPINKPEKVQADPTLFTGIRDILDQLNERPRKVLDWDCPKNAFKKLVGALET